jgi:Domain of unknown function (DUF4148)
MKLSKFLVFSAILTVSTFPVVSFSQSNQPITRAEVRAQLVELEKNGYNPASDHSQYPKNIEAAEARLNGANSVSRSSYGPSANGTSASGSNASQANVIGLEPIYARP